MPPSERSVQRGRRTGAPQARPALLRLRRAGALGRGPALPGTDDQLPHAGRRLRNGVLPALDSCAFYEYRGRAATGRIPFGCRGRDDDGSRWFQATSGGSSAAAAHRFAFVLHPLTVDYLANHPRYAWTRHLPRRFVEADRGLHAGAVCRHGQGRALAGHGPTRGRPDLRARRHAAPDAHAPAGVHLPRLNRAVRGRGRSAARRSSASARSRRSSAMPASPSRSARRSR